MVAILGFSRARVLAAVRDMYTEVAAAPDQPFHFPVGRGACLKLGYPPELLDAVPAEALESFAGVGYPFRAQAIRPGDVVLDVGSGSGTDALVAARLTGPAGKVYGLDMTAAMARKLRRLASAAGIGHLAVIEGNAEAIPLADASVDVVTSNGVLNLVPDKRRAVAEIFRVLKPGGRMQLADIVIHRPVTPDCRADPKLWAECVVGATVDEDYLALFRDAGFERIESLRDHDYFALSRSHETREVAARFGARAIELSLLRGAVAPGLLPRLARRLDPRRLIRSVRRRGLEGAFALLLAVLACYGSLAAVGLLSLAGLTLALSDAAVSGTILAFVALAVVAVGAGWRRHAQAAPFGVALLGGAIVAYAHGVDFSFAVEFAGFALVALAIFLDRRAHGHFEQATAYRTPQKAP
jgi:arsenite methyltransferase